MRVGLIARADSRGLGIQTKAFHDAMQPAKTMVIDCPSQKPLPVRRDWYPGATWIHGLPQGSDFRRWLDDLDVVYTAETGYGTALWDEAEKAGVRTVLHANYEFLDRRDRPTVWAAPSRWHFDDFPAGAVFLPVPIATDRFPLASPVTERPAARFLHVVGRPAIHDRNGTDDLLSALRHVTTPVTVTITCQDPRYVAGLIAGHRIRSHIDVNVKPGDLQDYWDLYTGHDVMVLPRRFGGLCLPAQEAIGAGLPVIMPAIEPNTAWLPADWLTPATRQSEFRAKQQIAVHASDPHALAAKIDQLATDAQYFATSQMAARNLRQALSWDALLPLYREVMAGWVMAK